MELHRGKEGIGFSGMVLLSIGCSMAFSAPTSGQTVSDSARARIQDMTRRELQLTNLGEDDRRRNDPKRPQVMMDQVSEDFQRILILHNEIVRAITANKTFNYQFLSDAASEIRKRSARLQSSLKLPRSEPAAENRTPEPDLKVTEMKDELILLCRQIESFVKNPIIETPGTVDAQRFEEARRDLESVVELSSDIKKRADKRKY
jgi:hypothetical protein